MNERQPCTTCRKQDSSQSWSSHLQGAHWLRKALATHSTTCYDMNVTAIKQSLRDTPSRKGYQWQQGRIHTKTAPPQRKNSPVFAPSGNVQFHFVIPAKWANPLEIMAAPQSSYLVEGCQRLGRLLDDQKIQHQAPFFYIACAFTNRKNKGQSRLFFQCLRCWSINIIYLYIDHIFNICI